MPELCPRGQACVTLEPGTPQARRACPRARSFQATRSADEPRSADALSRRAQPTSRAWGPIPKACKTRGSGSATNSERVGIPSTTVAMTQGLASKTQETTQGSTYSTPLTASAARTMTRSPNVIGATHARRSAAAQTWRTSTGTIRPSPISCAGIALDGRAQTPGDGILKSPVTSCKSDSNSSCSGDVSGCPSDA